MMKKTPKTYAVAGYMEYVASIAVPLGKSIEVRFTGGKQNGYGVSPAKFTTTDPVLQKFIEKSEQFRSGKITLYQR